MTRQREAAGGKVFSPWKRHATAAGLRIGNLPKVAAALAAGVALFVGIGTFKVQVEEPLTLAERAAATAELKDLRDAAATYRLRAEASGTSDESKLDLSQEEIRMAQEARSRGVSADSTDAQLEAMAPAAKTVEKDAVDPLPRAIACIALPTACAYIWHIEMGHGWSLDSETRRIARFATRRPRALVTRRKSFLEED